MTKRTPALKRTQAAYEAKRKAEGAQITLAAQLKTAADVANFEALQARFPDLSKAAIVKLALRELAARKNRP